MGYEYNARGYLSKLKRGTAALTTYTAMDAWGNATGESFGNGVSTVRTFDELGRATGIGTAKGTATLQDEAYGWRSDGLLENRAVGSGATADTETFGYDHLGRLESAKTYVDEATPGASSTVDRSLSYGYDRLGNLTSKPGASITYAGITYAGTGNAGPNAATSANLGVATTISYDTSGHVTGYAAAAGDDTLVEWDGRGMVSRITVGASKTDTTPTARDEFRYGPDGERYYRKTTWTETVTDAQGTSTTRTRWTEVYRVGGYEKVVGDGLGDYAWVDKTRAGAAQLVRTAATATPASAVEYLHEDHLGSPAAATDATGAALLSLAHDPYGTRRKADWTAALPAAEVAALASGQDAGRARNGFTGHETLDRTGFVHMGGRLYDPRLGRFPSPDPIVSEPLSGQGWNLYSYVGNSPLSRTDPTGHCYAAGPLWQLAAGGGGFTNVTSALTRWSVSWRVPIYVSIGQWGPVSFGVGVSCWNGENGGLFGRGGFFRSRVTLRIGLPYAVFNAVRRTVSLGQETSPADAAIISELLAYWPVFTREDLVSIGVGSIPVVGTVQSVAEVISGRDYITNERVHRGVAAAGILAGVVPGGQGALKAGTKIIGKFGPRGGRLSLRKRMEAEGPPPFPGAQAHHDLPQALRDRFEAVGLDIHDPAYGRWVGDGHQKWSREFGRKWRELFGENADPTAEEILAKMNELRATGKYQ